MLPSSKESLHAFVHAQFREAFGTPLNVEGGGEQWTLTPNAAYSSAIHVVLNGTRQGPGVWVFDPFDPKDGVENSLVKEPRDVSELINLIQLRLSMATRPKLPHLSAPAAPIAPAASPAAPDPIEPVARFQRRRVQNIHH
jgi:hypothetical protein